MSSAAAPASPCPSPGGVEAFVGELATIKNSYSDDSLISLRFDAKLHTKNNGVGLNV